MLHNKRHILQVKESCLLKDAERTQSALNNHFGHDPINVRRSTSHLSCCRATAEYLSPHSPIASAAARATRTPGQAGRAPCASCTADGFSGSLHGTLASVYRIHVVMLIRVFFQPFTGNKKARIFVDAGFVRPKTRVCLKTTKTVPQCQPIIISMLRPTLLNAASNVSIRVL